MRFRCLNLMSLIVVYCDRNQKCLFCLRVYSFIWVLSPICQAQKKCRKIEKVVQEVVLSIPNNEIFHKHLVRSFFFFLWELNLFLRQYRSRTILMIIDNWCWSAGESWNHCHNATCHIRNRNADEFAKTSFGMPLLSLEFIGGVWY